ncbi:MAG: hypothetical protein EP333_09365 [Bacteroidetes bacterium]|nr:MAG: hypothetical protein EP333_09365 [Bacteroidota bacterium]
MKTKLFLGILFLVSNIYSVLAQTQGVSYTAVGRGVATSFVTDYQALGINPSALGWGNKYGKHSTVGSTEFNFGIYSDSLNVDKLRDLYKAIRNDITGKENDTNAWKQQRQYASEYLRAGLTIDASYNWLGYSFHNEKFGGIAVSITENYNWYSKLNDQTAGLIFEGKFADYFDSLTVVFNGDTSTIYNSGNVSQDTLSQVISGTISVPLKLSEITNGSEIRFTWNRHYNFGYGRKLFGQDSTFAIYAGIGGRFIQSMAMLSMISDGDDVYLYSSFSPSYKIDYGAIANSNPSNFQPGSGGIPKSVGNGYGVDFSVSAKLLGFLTLSAAINNIGSVTYTRNVYRVADSLVGTLTVDGLENYNVTNSYEQLLSDGGILYLEGQEKFSLPNAAVVRMGGHVDLGNIASVGFDFIAPFDRQLPGSVQNGVLTLGGEVRPIKWLTLMAGYYGGGIYKHNIPIGINFVFGGGAYEMGISSRDMLSFFMDKSNSVSTAFGFARVRF